MQLAFSDLETFWSTEHTLTRMSPVAYCMHPETELISWSIKIGNAPTDVIFGEKEIKRIAAKFDWSDKFIISHNGSAFDHMIHAWRMGIKPRMWGCTLAMARPIHAKTVGLSLAKLVAHYGIGVKQDAVLHQTRGRHLRDFTPAEIAAMAVYNKADTEQCRELFFELAKHYTPAELWHIDCNIRMLVEPEFELDAPLLEAAASVERSNKHRALMDLAKHLRKDWRVDEDLMPLDWSDEEAVAEFTRAQMASAPKFSAVLASRGVDVPMKWSKTDKTKRIPAIAKTDEAMEELLEDEDEVVACAARARLSAKSTQLETRIASFLATNEIVGKLPVPAHYCGADTTGRDSGFLYNMLNLPRINPDKPKVSDALRNGVRAPEGKVIFVADLSGIELRVNHTLWKVKRTMDMWKAKPDADLYRKTAARMYHIEEDDVQKPQRQYAKVLELACGFQQGGKTFRQTARIQGGIRLTLAEASEGVQFWRGLYTEISDGKDGGWAQCHDALNYIARGDKVAIDDWGLCTTEKDAIVLPSGRRIRYPDLREEWVDDWKEVDGLMVASKKKAWVYGHGRHYAFIYGGKCTENIVQALARDVIFPNAMEFWKRTKLRPKHKVYDELVYLASPKDAPDLLAELQSIMRTPPTWWPSLVLWSEGDIAQSYGAAK